MSLPFNTSIRTILHSHLSTFAPLCTPTVTYIWKMRRLRLYSQVLEEIRAISNDFVGQMGVWNYLRQKYCFNPVRWKRALSLAQCLRRQSANSPDSHKPDTSVEHVRINTFNLDLYTKKNDSLKYRIKTRRSSLSLVRFFL